MKKNLKINIILALGLLLILFSCSEKQLDQIDTNPNSPIDVPLKLMLPQSITNSVYSIAGGYTAMGVSTYVEHTTSVRLNTIYPWDVNESLWTRVYYALNDLNDLMEKAQKEGSYTYLGIGQILYAYNLDQLTDIYGDVPNSEAVRSQIRAPKFDTQEQIYNYLFDILDQAITNLDKESVSNPKNVDLIFNGNISLWKKTAYGLMARFHNRLSNLDPQGSANKALSAIANSFANQNEGFIFNKYTSGNAFDNPWSGMQNSQEIFAVCTTLLNVMGSFSGTVANDPRSDIWFSKINGNVVGAPSGTSVYDQVHKIYSQPSRTNVLVSTAAQPLLTFDELKFIEAEAYLRLGNKLAADSAYKSGIKAALGLAGVASNQINTYLQNPTVLPAANNLTLSQIIGQKYLAFWLFQPIEAFNDFRRTGFPNLNNPSGTPKRLPYPTVELSRNPNAPTNINNVTIFTMPIWWAKQ